MVESHGYGSHLVEKALGVDGLDGIPHLNERHASASNKLDLGPKKLIDQQQRQRQGRSKHCRVKRVKQRAVSWASSRRGRGRASAACLSYVQPHKMTYEVEHRAPCTTKKSPNDTSHVQVAATD